MRQAEPLQSLPGWQQTPAAKFLLCSPVASTRPFFLQPYLGILVAPCMMPGIGSRVETLG